MRISAICLLVACSMSTFGCGGSSGNSTGMVTPTPSPSSTATPTPTPTPGTTSTINLAGATNGSVLQVRRVCSITPPIYTGGRITGIGAVGSIAIQPPETARYLTGPERIEAFADTFYTSPSGGSRQFTLFQSLSDFSLTVANTLSATQPSATFGYTDRPGFCFYAAGLAPASDALQSGYDGRADGLYQTAAGARRLYGSRVQAVVNQAARTGTLRMDLTAYNSAFPDLAVQIPAVIGTVTANLSFSGTEVTASSVSGPGGFTGTVSGVLVGNDGMALAFDLRDPAGGIIWGAAAFDNAACNGCWDY